MKWREYIKKKKMALRENRGGGHKNHKEKSKNKNIERRE